MTVLHTGSTKKYAENWNSIFTGAHGAAKTAKKKSAKPTAKKSSAKKKPAAAKAKK